MNDCGISKLDLKRRNRMQILRVIREQGPISRVDIALQLQITRAAVTIITNEMIEEKILEEVGEAPFGQDAAVRKGRRKILLDINETFRFAVGIYMDEKELSIGLTTMHSAVMDRRTIQYEGTLTPAQVAEMAAETVQTMLQNSCLSPHVLLGIGVGVMPEMNTAMGGRWTEQGTLEFPELEEQLKRRFSLPVYVENAVRQMAMAGVTFQQKHVRPMCQAFVYWNGSDFLLMLTQGMGRLDDQTFLERNISSISVDPDGGKAVGCPRGSVLTALSPGALQEKIAGIFSQQQTPRLYAMLEGDLSRLTMAQLLTAMEQEPLLRQPAEEFLRRFCVLLSNIHTLFETDTICLYGFDFTETHIAQIRAYAKEFGGAALGNAIVSCPIEGRNRFLCGSTYAIQKGFYQRGGMQ